MSSIRDLAGSRARSRTHLRTRPLFVLISCEHGGNRIPARYRQWFAGQEAALASHRGYDPGALATARLLAAATGARLAFATVSRLLVELNRSAHHPRVFSDIIRRAPRAVRREVFERYYVPYHQAIGAEVAAAIAAGALVVHLGSHSFTPVFDGIERRADAGVLYDPARALEARFAAHWVHALRARGAGVVRRNYPYEGRNDGLPTVLRRRFAPEDYLGLELEVNQRHALAGGPAWARLQRGIAAALPDALRAFAAEVGAEWPTRPRAARESARRSRAAAPGADSRAASRADR
jgi:predicted N-formylglutamate amidohydrolase